MTKIHAKPALFGKVTAMTEPKHAVAYQFQCDFDTLPATIRAVEAVCNGPVDYATDYLVWKMAKGSVRTRMAAPNPEYFPTPPPQERKIEMSGDHYQAPELILDGFPDEMVDLTNEIYDDPTLWIDPDTDIQGFPEWK